MGGKDLVLDEAQTDTKSHVDDEYSKVGTYDPKIVITTSRDPSSRLLQFSKVGPRVHSPEDVSTHAQPLPPQELRLIFPNSYRINRGNYVIRDLVSSCTANNVTDLLLVHEHRGVPDALIICHLPHGPTLSLTLHNVVLRHDISSNSTSTVSEQYPHLIFENFGTKLGERVMSVMKALFPVPKDDAKRVMTFVNESDFISFRHHVFVKNSHKDIQLAEVGPRFEAKPYEIKQGTIDQTEADIEWLLRPYMRTAKKRNQM
ncbi:U3 small nucleolar ribonucleoprotein IMP4, partial [Tremellales sp. Uapishka_1]